MLAGNPGEFLPFVRLPVAEADWWEIYLLDSCHFSEVLTKGDTGFRFWDYHLIPEEYRVAKGLIASHKDFLIVKIIKELAKEWKINCKSRDSVDYGTWLAGEL